jgi:hypothetical protein
MIVAFTVKNYKSIKDEVTLKMQPTVIKHNLENVILTNNKQIPRLLKSAFICGQNASGKSNVLEALKTMCKIIQSKPAQDALLDYNPFRLDIDTQTMPTDFELIFLVDNIRYVYGFSYNSEKIIKEYLYYYPNGKITCVFERHSENMPVFKFNDKKEQQQEVAKNLSRNNLYLSVAAWLNIGVTKVAYDYFSKKIVYIGSKNVENEMQSLVQKISLIKDISDDNYKQQLEASLVYADLGVKGIDIKYSELPSLVKEITQTISGKILENEKQKELTNYLDNFQNPTLLVKHIFIDKDKRINEVLFDLNKEESNGTIKLFFLMSFIIDAIKSKKTLLIDEIEINLHPSIINYITAIFNCDKNLYSQLIFTTHNYDLLSLDNSGFRKDQVWFTEKDLISQSTQLYSLNDFKERKGLDIKKRYFNGKYGTLPNIYGDIFE